MMALVRRPYYCRSCCCYSSYHYYCCYYYNNSYYNYYCFLACWLAWLANFQCTVPISNAFYFAQPNTYIQPGVCVCMCVRLRSASQ